MRPTLLAFAQSPPLPNEVGGQILSTMGQVADRFDFGRRVKGQDRTGCTVRGRRDGEHSTMESLHRTEGLTEADTGDRVAVATTILESGVEFCRLGKVNVGCGGKAAKSPVISSGGGALGPGVEKSPQCAERSFDFAALRSG